MSEITARAPADWVLNFLTFRVCSVEFAVTHQWIQSLMFKPKRGCTRSKLTSNLKFTNTTPTVIKFMNVFCTRAETFCTTANVVQPVSSSSCVLVICKPALCISPPTVLMDGCLGRGIVLCMQTTCLQRRYSKNNSQCTLTLKTWPFTDFAERVAVTAEKHTAYSTRKDKKKTLSLFW